MLVRDEYLGWNPASSAETRNLGIAHLRGGILGIRTVYVPHLRLLVVGGIL